jgi:hypothetical protein
MPKTTQKKLKYSSERKYMQEAKPMFIPHHHNMGQNLMLEMPY